ncbi:MAG: YraN family protein [Lachnospiraceae bacterium]|nr:YraN family protein [Lachnospiraceae bacterium]
MNRRSVGRRYETIACKILEGEGMSILARNFRTHEAEIDIVAEDGDVLVFVEVKYRRDASSGGPFMAVDKKKQERICRAADVFLLAWHFPPDMPVRFDVMGFLGNRYKHMKNAFSYRR